MSIANPINLNRRNIAVAWGAFALVLLLAPSVVPDDFSVSLLSQIGIAIIACLSYNILFGQGGMLSFGHAVYTGIGSFMAIHALSAVSSGSIRLPVSLLPLVGGLAGAGCAVLFGWVTTRRSGISFAMITLGMGELVIAIAMIWTDFFGGEAGVASNRVTGSPAFGVSLGPQIQVYYLIAIYVFLSAAAMYALTHTPLGRILNAVRDNAERVAFIGYDARHVRFLAFVISGFFAGISGGLAAINFEIVTADYLSLARSGGYLLFTFIGGATHFLGPVIGAVLMVVATVLLSELTKGWLLYLGLIFLLMVVYAPSGVAGLMAAAMQAVRSGKLARTWRLVALMVVALAFALVGASFCIELVYHRSAGSAAQVAMSVFGIAIQMRQFPIWLGAGVLLAALGLGSLTMARRRVARLWEEDAITHRASTAAIEGGAT